ncbi:MAG: hypothetical protein AAF587_28300 [Bacteroidota bacterium]
MNIYHSLFSTWVILFFAIFCLFSIGCGPQHHYAFQQFGTPHKGSILSVQGYVFNPSEETDFKNNWNILAAEMKKKPGFVLASLSSGVGESRLILAHSEWKDLESLRNAFSDQQILALEAKLPKKQFEHLFGMGTLGYYTKK